MKYIFKILKAGNIRIEDIYLLLGRNCLVL
jgi:hypothetical protein